MCLRVIRFFSLLGLLFPALAIALTTQTVTFAPVSTVGIGVSPITLAATASSGLSIFTFSTSSAASICTVTGSKVTIVGVGTCSLTASQAGDATFSSASANANINVVPSQARVTLIEVLSRKIHGASGPFDVSVDAFPLANTVTVEPRAIGSAHTIIFQFSGPVTSVSGVTAVDARANSYSAGVSFTNSEVFVSLAGLPDNKYVVFSLLGVNGSFDQVVPIGFLIGDVNNTHSVNSSDIKGAKARSGQLITNANFKFDVNTSGNIDFSDISAIKARSGLVLPMPVVLTAPSIASTAPVSGTVSEPYSFTFNATGTSPISWAVSAGTLPTGITLNPVSGELSGTPAAQGTTTFTVQASNEVQPNATKSVTLQINPVTRITSAPPPPATASFFYTHTFTAVGAQPIMWSANSGGLPAWASLNANTGVLSGTPTSAGTVSFTVTATNPATSVNQAVTLVVNPPVAPTIISGTPLAIGTIGEPYSFTFAATGTTPMTWSLVSGRLPRGLTLSASGVLSGTPTSAGFDDFMVQAANNVLPNAVSANFAITVTAADVSTDGITLANVSKFAFIIPPYRDFLLNGAGPEVNAFPMAPSRCSTVPALSRSWQHNIDLADYKSKNAFDFFAMQANESLSYKFTVGIVDASGGFIYNDTANAVVRPTFISITTTPCDFDTSKLVVGALRDACYQTGLNGNSINWANILGPLPGAYCRLVKGQTYYMNLRFQDGRPASIGGSPTSDSCTTGNCGGIIQVL